MSSSLAGSNGASGASGRKALQDLVRSTEFILFVLILLVGALITALNPEFLTARNLFSVLKRNTFLGILALGELVVLIAGGIDVSFTATATVGQYAMGLIISNYMIDNVFLAFLIPIPIGIVLGAINAGIVHYTRVHPVIITIATLNVFHGFLVFATGGTWIYSFPASFAEFSNATLFTLTGADGGEYSLSAFVLFWVAAAVLTWAILRFMPIGRKTYAMGANMEAARRTGYNIFRIHLFVYGYIGALAGVAAFVHAELNQMIQPNSIVGRELEVLAATVLGGASILGGKGKVSGTILGVLLLGVMRNGLILMGVPAYWHQVLFGFIIVAAASMNAIQSTVHSRRRVASPATEAAQGGTVSATGASDSSDERGRQS